MIPTICDILLNIVRRDKYSAIKSLENIKLKKNKSDI